MLQQSPTCSVFIGRLVLANPGAKPRDYLNTTNKLELFEAVKIFSRCALAHDLLKDEETQASQGSCLVGFQPEPAVRHHADAGLERGSFAAEDILCDCRWLIANTQELESAGSQIFIFGDSLVDTLSYFA